MNRKLFVVLVNQRSMVHDFPAKNKKGNSHAKNSYQESKKSYTKYLMLVEVESCNKLAVYVTKRFRYVENLYE